MKITKRCLGILLIVVLIATLFVGCKKSDKTKYFGTWTKNNGSDMVSCMIFDENGYWEIFVDYQGLLNGMKQKPDAFSTFEDFIDGNTLSGVTHCTFKYVSNSDYADIYEIDESGKLSFKDGSSITPYTKFSDNTGYPEDAIIEKVKAIFDRAMADSKK